MSTASRRFLQLGTRYSEVVCVRTTSAQSIEHHEEVTYGALFHQSSGFAQRLYSLGLVAGHRVALWSTVGQEVLAIEQAILGLGGVVVQIAPQAEHQVVFQQLEECQVDMLIVDCETRYLAVESELDELYTLVHILSIENGEEVLPLTEAAVQPDWFKEQILQRQRDEPALIHWLDGSKYQVNTQEELLEPLSWNLSSTDVLLVDKHCTTFFPFCWILHSASTPSTLLLCQLEQMEHCLDNIRPTVLVLSAEVVQSTMTLLHSYAAQIHPWMLHLMGWSLGVEKMLKRTSKRRLRLQATLLRPVVRPVLYRFFGRRLRYFIVGEAVEAVDILSGWTTCLQLIHLRNPE